MGVLLARPSKCTASAVLCLMQLKMQNDNKWEAILLSHTDILVKQQWSGGRGKD